LAPDPTIAHDCKSAPVRRLNEAAAPNSRTAILERRREEMLGWRAPLLMLFARSAFAVIAQGLVAALCRIRGSASPWLDAGHWLPVYGTFIDAGCLGALWWLARREGTTLLDLTGFDRNRFSRDVLLGIALVPPSLVLILAGNLASSFIAFRSFAAPDVFAPLPLVAALYGVLVFPIVWAITEQTTYNGYLVPRLQVLSGNTAFAVASVAIFWSFQHAVMPLTFDRHFMLYRALAPLPFSTFQAFLYLRLRRIVPLATAHWLMDGGDAFFRTLWPLLK
jgi:hypothetical protein